MEKDATRNIEKPESLFAKFLREKRNALARNSANKRKRKIGPDQAETALNIGISPASYRALEGAGPVNPTLQTLFQIQDYHNVPDDEFWGKVVPSLRLRVIKNHEAES